MTSSSWTWKELTKPQQRALRLICLLGQSGATISKRTDVTHRTVNGDVAQRLVSRGLAGYQWVKVGHMQKLRLKITDKGSKLVAQRKEAAA